MAEQEQRIHSCPDCRCQPACDLCRDTGYVGKFETTAEWVGPWGERQASSMWSLEPCPNGCPRPMAFYSTVPV